MKYVKPIVITIFIIVAIIFVINWARYKIAIDQNGPTIHMGSKLLKVSVEDKDEKLLKDVKAFDKKDGDITNSVVIESISPFVDKKKHISNITYAVADSDHNVSKATRRIQFTDYEHPKFTLKKPLKLETGSDDDIRNIIGAKDCVDGNISRKVKILSTTFSTLSTGDSTVTAQVTNSLGDTITMKAHVVIKSTNVKAPTINLTKNIDYVKKGSSFDEMKYIKSVTNSSDKEISSHGVKVLHSTVNTKKNGCYYVEYIMNEGKENESSTNLIIIVED